ncbi:MarR family winged helix-turn-helix transcriptional regulator [Paucilactobacillus nenjiangensis]|jgi:DNA-binding MarR family transcriptional regulator|uniref:MarR family transcriptional regulator n=1 Tax=Paucilactobacillus nenjiangensis TaxID=1296540 RepID=A0A5P1WYB6_9LACO|nr:MarR family transcriptional regulator [Paucilactobacillus nenjiangensis]QER66566.1 MarR family transcriptional regulator [Paucilactobacillus nenjiangensis]
MDKTQLAQIRQFNRDYVLILGILNNSMKNLDFSLTEGRVLFEIHDGQTVIANKLAIKIGLDRGYLNRIIKKLEQLNLVSKESSPKDNRVKILHTTVLGQQAIDKINLENDNFTAEVFSKFNNQELKQIIKSMELISARLL